MTAAVPLTAKVGETVRLSAARNVVVALEPRGDASELRLGVVDLVTEALGANPTEDLLAAGAFGLVGTLWFSLTPPVQAVHGHRGAGTRSRRGVGTSSSVTTLRCRSP